MNGIFAVVMVCAYFTAILPVFTQPGLSIRLKSKNVKANLHSFRDRPDNKHARVNKKHCVCPKTCPSVPVFEAAPVSFITITYPIVN